MRLDTATLCAALLHDTVEDTSASLDEVREAFGEEVAGPRRRRDQAHRDRLPVARRGAGRELPQDDGRDGHGHPGHPDQARRPPAQHAHDRARCRSRSRSTRPRRPWRSTRRSRTASASTRSSGSSRTSRSTRCTRASTRRSRAWSTSSARSASATWPRRAATWPRSSRRSASSAEISGRAKHFYSIYSKMTRKGREFNEIYDLTAMRVIVDSVKDCYGAVGVIHSLWKPLPGPLQGHGGDAEVQHVPGAAHDGDRARGAAAGDPDPHPRHARDGRVRRRRALALQGGRHAATPATRRRPSCSG